MASCLVTEREDQVSQVELEVKNLPVGAGDSYETQVCSPPLEENGPSRILARRIMDRGAWQAAVSRGTQSQT